MRNLIDPEMLDVAAAGMPEGILHTRGVVDECATKAHRTMLNSIARAVTQAVRPTPVDAPAVPMLVLDAYWQDRGDSQIDRVWPWIDVISLTTREVYAGQLVGQGRIVPAYHGAVLKATQGTGYYTRARRWFGRQWRELLRAREEAGAEFWRGAYHYLEFLGDGTKQADYYLNTVDSYGGFRDGDIRPIVDIEFGGPTARNRKAKAQQIIDCAHAFSARVVARTGRKPILYGGASLSERGITDHLGCEGLWPAAYTATLSPREATSIGWKPSEILMWQYTDGTKGSAVTTRGTKLPIGVHGFGALDCSVVTAPGGYAGARRALTGVL